MTKLHNNGLVFITVKSLIVQFIYYALIGRGQAVFQADSRLERLNKDNNGWHWPSLFQWPFRAESLKNINGRDDYGVLSPSTQSKPFAEKPTSLPSYGHKPANNPGTPELVDEMENYIGEEEMRPPQGITSAACTAEGFFRIENDCTHFYRCVHNGAVGHMTFTKFEFSCGKGTVWDPDNMSCNYPWAVQRTDCRNLVNSNDENDSNQENNQGNNNSYPDMNGNGEGDPVQNNNAVVGPAQENGQNVGNGEKPQGSYQSVSTSSTSGASSPTIPPKPNSENGYVNRPSDYGNLGENPSSSPFNQSQNTVENNPNRSCMADGFYPVLNNCKKFFRCVSSGYGGYTKYEFDCAEGTIWDVDTTTCNFPYAVNRQDCNNDANGSDKPINNENLGETSTTQKAPEFSGQNSIPSQYPSDSTTNQQSSSNNSSTSSTNSSSSSSSSSTSSNSSSTSSSMITNQQTSSTSNQQSINSSTNQQQTSGSSGQQNTNAANNQQQSSSTTSGQQGTNAAMNQQQTSSNTYSQQGTNMATNQQQTSSTLGNNNLQTLSNNSNSQGSTSNTNNQQTSMSGSNNNSQGIISSQNSNSSGGQQTSTTNANSAALATNGQNANLTTVGSSSSNTNNSTNGTATITVPMNQQGQDPCTSEGFFPSNRSCQRFYRCVSNGGLGYTKYEFNCGPGTVWDHDHNTCNHPWAVSNEHCRSGSVNGGENMEATSTSPSQMHSSSTTPSYSISSTKLSDKNKNNTNSKPSSTTALYSTTPAASLNESHTSYNKPTMTSASSTTIKPTLTSSLSSNQMTTTVSPYTTNNNSDAQSTSTPSIASTIGEKPEICKNTTSPPKCNDQIKCEKAGFYPHPQSCKKFYRCVDWDDKGEQFSVFYFDCPAGTIFDPSLSICNHENSVYPPRDCTGDDGYTTSSTMEVDSNQSSCMPINGTSPSTSKPDTTTSGYNNETTDTESNIPAGTTNSSEISSSEGNTSGPQMTTDSGYYTDLTSSNTGSTLTMTNSLITNPPALTTIGSGTSITDDGNTLSSSTSPTQTEITTMIISTTIASEASDKCPRDISDDQFILVCPTGFRRHPKYCDVFYQCTTSETKPGEIKVLTLSCTNGTVYDAKKIQCLPPDQTGKCETRMMVNSGRNVKQMPITGNFLPLTTSSKSFCPNQGSFPYADDCSLFYKCSSNKSGKLNGYIYQCPEGYVYYNLSKRCEKMNKVPCESGKRLSPVLKSLLTITVPVETKNIGH